MTEAKLSKGILDWILVRKGYFGGLGKTCSSRDPTFVGSNPAEVDNFFQDVKILSTSPSGGTLRYGT